MLEFTVHLETFSKKYTYKYLALYHAIRAAIHQGNLPEGMRLPSSRELASRYGLSRGSVSQAYDMLNAEGYVRTVIGSGTFVIAPHYSSAKESQEARPMVLSRWGRRVEELMAATGEAADRIRPAATNSGGISSDLISYRDGGTWEALFPVAEWRSALTWAETAGHHGLMATVDPAGDKELREAIAAYLRRARGIAAEAAQICLFNGSLQAITLLTQLLLDEGEFAFLEDPCYYGITRAVAACGGVAVPGRMDEEGLVPRDWEAKLLFVTPGRQFPTGAVLPYARRRELLAWASQRNAVIIEDDYDSELRWAGRPLEPLKALDQEDGVVYIGSFSKTMFGALRIGYAVVPRSLIRPVANAKALYEPLPASRLEQRALARFMRTGGYERHLRRMRRHYGAKQEVFRRALEQELGLLFKLRPADAGLLLYAEWLLSPEAYQTFREAALDQGVVFRDAAAYRLTPGTPAACFGFAHLEEEQLLEGIRRMKSAWDDIQAGRYRGIIKAT